MPTNTLPDTATLRSWSDDPTTAREHLRAIFSVLDAEENTSRMGNRGAGNCDCGPPLAKDIAFLIEQASAAVDPQAYWPVC